MAGVERIDVAIAGNCRSLLSATDLKIGTATKKNFPAPIAKSACHSISDQNGRGTFMATDTLPAGGVWNGLSESSAIATACLVAVELIENW